MEGASARGQPPIGPAGSCPDEKRVHSARKAEFAEEACCATARWPRGWPWHTHSRATQAVGRGGLYPKSVPSLAPRSSATLRSTMRSISASRLPAGPGLPPLVLAGDFGGAAGPTPRGLKNYRRYGGS